MVAVTVVFGTDVGVTVVVDSVVVVNVLVINVVVVSNYFNHRWVITGPIAAP